MSAHQREKILRLLMARRGEWIPSTEFSAISLQYGARILELRADLRANGHDIVNKVIHTRNGRRHGYFKLLSELEERATRIGMGESVKQSQIEDDSSQPSLFTEEAHRDEN